VSGFHWDKELRSAAEHLSAMYAVPGSKWHAVARLDERDSDPTWAGLLALVPLQMAADLPAYRAKKEATRGVPAQAA
jgi:hypothetical protein